MTVHPLKYGLGVLRGHYVLAFRDRTYCRAGLPSVVSGESAVLAQNVDTTFAKTATGHIVGQTRSP